MAAHGLYEGMENGIHEGLVIAPQNLQNGLGFTRFVEQFAHYKSTRYNGVANYTQFVNLLPSATNFSINIWIYILAHQPAANMFTPIIGDSGGYWSICNRFGSGDDNYTFIWFNGGTREAIPRVRLRANAWYNLAAQMNPDLLQGEFYVNGTFIGFGNWFGGVQDITFPTRLGGQGIAGFNNNVIVNLLQVYNRYLTPQEVRANYNIGNPPNPNSNTPMFLSMTNSYLNGVMDVYPIIRDRKGNKNGTMLGGMNDSSFIYNMPHSA